MVGLGLGLGFIDIPTDKVMESEIGDTGDGGDGGDLNITVF